METLFCASNPKAVENAISEIRGKLSLVDGISSVVGQGLDIASDVTDLIGVGGDTLKKAKELNEKVGKTTGTLGGILTKLIDSLTKTTKGTDTNATDPNSAPSTIFGMGDSRYQPFHEPGNLFSYPGSCRCSGLRGSPAAHRSG